MSGPTAWQRRTLAEIDALTIAIDSWPVNLRVMMGVELQKLHGFVGHLDGSAGGANKAYVTRRLRALRAEIERVIITTPAERVPAAERAYNGDAEPQRGELTPRERDIVCRAITHEIEMLGRPLPDDAPAFLAGLTIHDADAERPLLRRARALLSPRTDDAQAAQAAVAHDARTFPAGGPT